MKAKDLITQLNALNPELDVVCYCEDQKIVPPKRGFRLFEITGVNSRDVEKTRGTDGIHSLILGKTPFSSPHVFINITVDF